MRLLRMNGRSRYKGLSCLHCHKPVKDGRAVLCSTYYIRGDGRPGDRVTTYSTIRIGPEWMIRIVYHRKCMEGILARGPLDPEVEASMFDEYRARLVERLSPKPKDPDLAPGMYPREM